MRFLRILLAGLALVALVRGSSAGEGVKQPQQRTNKSHSDAPKTVSKAPLAKAPQRPAQQPSNAIIAPNKSQPLPGKSGPSIPPNKNGVSKGKQPVANSDHKGSSAQALHSGERRASTAKDENLVHDARVHDNLSSGRVTLDQAQSSGQQPVRDARVRDDFPTVRTTLDQPPPADRPVFRDARVRDNFGPEKVDLFAPKYGNSEQPPKPKIRPRVDPTVGPENSSLEPIPISKNSGAGGGSSGQGNSSSGSSGSSEPSSGTTKQTAKYGGAVLSNAAAGQKTLEDKQGEKVNQGTPNLTDGQETIGGGNSSNSGQKSAESRLGDRGIVARRPVVTGESTNENPKGSTWKDKRQKALEVANGRNATLNDLTRESQLNNLNDPLNILADHAPQGGTSRLPGKDTGDDPVTTASRTPRNSDGKNKSSKQGEQSGGTADVYDDETAAKILEAAVKAGGGSVTKATDSTGTVKETIYTDKDGTMRMRITRDNAAGEDNVWKFDKNRNPISHERSYLGAPAVKLKSTPSPDNPDATENRPLPAIILPSDKRSQPPSTRAGTVAERKRQVTMPGEGGERPERMNVDKKELMQAGLLRRTDGRSQPVPQAAQNTDRRGTKTPKAPIRPGGPDEGGAGVPTPTTGRGPNPDDPTADGGSDKK